MADFLDLFNHRLIALFYRAWAKYRLTVQYEDHARAEQRDPITRVLRALAGQQPFQQQETQLYYGGHFARHTRSAAALQHMLQDFLGYPVTIESFIGQWLPIQPADRAVLGRLGRNHHLGSGILIGKRVWDVQSRFRIIIGPLRQSDYEQLLPDRQRFQKLSRLVNSYTPHHLNVELKFLINHLDAPRAIGKRPAADKSKASPSPPQEPPRLGWNTWLQGNKQRLRTATLQLPRGSHQTRTAFTKV